MLTKALSALEYSVPVPRNPLEIGTLRSKVAELPRLALSETLT